MDIRTTFSGDAQAIDISKIADDMLADVIADHARDRFRASNRANRDVAGTDITYTVTVNGRTVGGGRGEMLFPERQVAVVVRGTPGRRHSVVVDWLWEKIQPATFRKAIAAYGEFRSVASFVRFFMDPRGQVFRFLVTSYLRSRYPVAMARINALESSLGYARGTYRLYRLATGVTGRSGADPDVLAWIAMELRDRSPVVSGAYRDAHALYGDGRYLMDAEAVRADADLPVADEYSFTNTMPYARKIEMGKTQAGRDFVIQVPNRIYERVAQEAQARFRGLADISFEMRSVADGVQTPQRSARRQHNRPANRYPSIVVRF